MKLTTKLLITALSFSILTACGPKGPSKEQIAAEEQAKVAYETVKSDFEKYKTLPRPYRALRPAPFS